MNIFALPTLLLPFLFQQEVSKKTRKPKQYHKTSPSYKPRKSENAYVIGCDDDAWNILQETSHLMIPIPEAIEEFLTRRAAWNSKIIYTFKKDGERLTAGT